MPLRSETAWDDTRIRQIFPGYLVPGARKLTQIEIFPWNVGVSGHGGASADMPNHLSGGDVHWEYRDPPQPEGDATAHHQGPGYAPDVREASLKTQPRNAGRK
jgi:hypothetical protein